MPIQGTYSIHLQVQSILWNIPDSNVRGANMGPIWGRQDPGGPHVGPMNFAIWDARDIVDSFEVLLRVPNFLRFKSRIYLAA